jgi:type IV pilus assembly protein PilA
MLREMRARAANEKGFTLIELLVVILIIGILAAIAIPSFLNQKGKANDAQAKVVARTAETAEETVYTDAQAYVSQSAGSGAAGALNTIEKTLTGPSAACVGSLPYAVSPCGMTVTANATGYTISVTSRTGVVFSLARTNAGTVTRTCDVSGALAGAGNSGCLHVVGTTGDW